ncbi:MAG: acyltransferase [Deltaproteobacteria bacterium]|nr:acyltransferase [Deltaproteobacteria bacterium]MBW2724502.1 acyltransferase [Deltaproteobacteria bacterium]
MILRISWRLLTGILMRCLELLGEVFPESDIGCRIRGAIHRPFLKSCGKNFQVGLHAKLEHRQGIEVGDDVYIGHGSWLSGLGGGLVLHDQVMLGPYVTMVSANHTFVDGSARFGAAEPGRIEIGRGSWIAAGATIVTGSRVGSSCLIAAGAVVTMDVEDHAIAGGVPARVLGHNESENAKLG